MKNIKFLKKIAGWIVLIAVAWVVYVNFGLFCCTSF
jgi:hypothetical protein